MMEFFFSSYSLVCHETIECVLTICGISKLRVIENTRHVEPITIVYQSYLKSLLVRTEVIKMYVFMVFWMVLTTYDQEDHLLTCIFHISTKVELVFVVV